MKIIQIYVVSGLFISISHAAPFTSAVVTTVVNDVKLSERSNTAKAIGIGQTMGGSSTLLTGRKSRAALTFPDKTVSRIGANSAFRFRSGSRDMEIRQGSFLLQVPKGAGGATIRTSTVVAGITGTTTMMEFNPGISLKFICLEGTAKLTNKNGDSVQIPPGQMIVMQPDAPRFPRPIIVDVKRMVRTSALTDQETFGELEPDAEAAIDETIAEQMEEKREGRLLAAEQADGGDIKDDGRTLLSETYSSERSSDFSNGL